MRFDAGRPEQLDLVARQIGFGQQAEADGVVDVVVDVRDAIDDAHDLALERLRLLLARMREDAVADLVREVEPPGDDERVLVVAEVPTGVLVECLVEGLLSGVPERCVPHVVAEPDRFHEVLVEA